MIVVIGLGNPGFQYKNTMHNMGYKVVDKLSDKLGIEFSKNKYKAVIGEGYFHGEKIMLVKPETYMNNSGESAVMIKKKFKDARFIVAVDDMDLPKGKIRYREKGKSGTHNGMRSLVEYIGEDFERVRVGIGRNENTDIVDFVLSNIKIEDEKLFDDAIEEAANVIMEKIS